MPRLPVVLSMLLVLTAISITPAAAQDATPAVSPAPLAQRTALLVAATNAPLRVVGSDGLAHLEYDLVATNAFPFPVTLTAVEVLDAAGDVLVRLDGAALASVTQPLFGASLVPTSADSAPTAQASASGTIAVVVDLAVPAARVPTLLTHRIAYGLPPARAAASGPSRGCRTRGGGQGVPVSRPLCRGGRVAQLDAGWAGET